VQVAEIYRSYTRLLSKKLDELKPPGLHVFSFGQKPSRHSLSISAGRDSLQPDE